MLRVPRRTVAPRSNGAWEVDREVLFVFKRRLVYQSNTVHSVTADLGFGHELACELLTAVLFWNLAE